MNRWWKRDVYVTAMLVCIMIFVISLISLARGSIPLVNSAVIGLFAFLFSFIVGVHYYYCRRLVQGICLRIEQGVEPQVSFPDATDVKILAFIGQSRGDLVEMRDRSFDSSYLDDDDEFMDRMASLIERGFVRIAFRPITRRAIIESSGIQLLEQNTQRKHSYIREDSGRLKLSTQDLIELLKKEEGQTLERKPYLMWNSKKEEENTYLEYQVVEAIAAFLNTNPGVLIIGQDDKKQLIGIEKEYPHLRHNKKETEGYRLSIQDYVGKRIERHIVSMLEIEILSVQGRDVCFVKVPKSNKEVFVKDMKGKAVFCIREGPRTQKLEGTNMTSYIKREF